MSIESALLKALYKGDESELRSTPEGREYLLGEALKRRKEPFDIRMFPRRCGRAARNKLDQILFNVLKATQ